MNSQVLALDLQTNAVVGTFTADLFATVLVSPDSSEIYTTLRSQSTGDFNLEQISAATLQVSTSLPIGTNSDPADAPVLAMSPSGNELVAATSFNYAPSATLVSLPSLRLGAVTPVSGVCDISFVSNREFAVTSCESGSIDAVDLTTSKIVARYNGGSGPQATLASPGGKVVYSYTSTALWTISTQTGQVLSKL